MRLLSHLLDRFISRGSLFVIDSSGTTHEFIGIDEGPKVTIRIHTKALERDLFFNPELKAGEAYMDGLLTVEDGGDIHDFLYLFSINRKGITTHPWLKALGKAVKATKALHQNNRSDTAKANARHHYDISRDLYRLFLDVDLNYSCAYFRDPEHDTLEEAQQAKLRHAASKLQLRPGMSVAEIGSGWGSFAVHLAELEDIQVVGITPSPEQIAVAREKAEAAGVADRVRFEQMDYRELDGQFDRVVSVGMFEHVGVPHFDAFFGKVRDLLKPGGFAYLHAIGKMSPPGTTSPFIRKYIFPGGYVPALSEVTASTERSKLWVADIEVLRLHYHYTLEHWRKRFAANREAAAELYDERFCRMWEFYLSAASLGFLHGSNMVFQMLLATDRDAVPITRDYMFDAERAMIAAAASDDDTVVPLRRPQ